MLTVHPIIILDHFAPVFQTTKRYVNMRGGRGSAKSHHAALKCLSWLLDSNHRQRIVCIRKYAEHIEGSVFQMFVDFRDTLYPHLQSQIKINKSPFKITCTYNGNEIIFRGVDDPEKIKSITGITKVWIEEPTELDEDDLKTISLSLRGAHITDYPQILLTYNPISETHWLKSRFWDEPPVNSFNHVSTYLGNPFLTAADVSEIESYKFTDPDYYKIIALNEWGVLRTGNEYFDKFKYSTHVTSDNLYREDLPIVLSFDSNNLPYSTCLPLQMWRDNNHQLTVGAISEICFPPPANTIDDIADEFFARYPKCSNIFFTGDPSMRSKIQRKSRAEAFSFEETIEDAFRSVTHNRSNIFLKKAPPLAKRRRAMNGILTGKNCNLIIHESCKNLIHDFESLQVDTTGGYVKKKVTDKKSGATYEQGGHTMDALIYYLAYEFRKEFF